MDRELNLPRRLPWHDNAWEALQSLKPRGVHAILLHGARGIGKKSLGFDLAQAALCESPQATGRACGKCTGCKLMEAGSHPDFRFVLPEALKALRPGHESAESEEDDAGNVEEPEKSARASREIRIDQIRALSDFAFVATHRGGGRVVLLAPAESLNAPAANALLKLLEEPPAQTLFVLATDALDELPPTIRSRCVLVRIAMPTKAAALDWLAAQGVENADAALAAAGGAPLAAWEVANGQSLAPDQSALLLDVLERGDSLEPAEIARRIPRDMPIAPAIAIMQRWCWDLLGYRTAGTVRYHPLQRSGIERLSRKIDPDELWRWAESLARAQASREHPLNSRLVLESSLLRYRDCIAGRQ
jgi:DNA polymerase-3 subunit delta'